MVLADVAHSMQMDRESTMSDALNYSLVRYQPSPGRHEVVNIGVVLFTPQGSLMEVVPQMGKLLAIDPNAQISAVYEQANSLHKTVQTMIEHGMSAQEAASMLGKAMQGASLMPLGSVVTGGREPQAVLHWLMAELVTPPTRKRMKRAAAHSRLSVELSTLFKQAKMLGSAPGDIAEHLVVQRYPIDADVGLFAEFALRNGKLHVTETVDFRVKDKAAKKREAEAKALVLIQALETVGKDDLQRYVVVSGADAETQASLNLLERYTDHLVVREDSKAWLGYINNMAKAANRPNMAQV